MQSTDFNITRQPMNAKARVRIHFDALYPDPDFRKWLVSTNHKDSITRYVMFDRAYAVKMIKEAAKKAGDLDTMNTPDGIVYSYMTKFMRDKREPIAA